MHGAFHTECGVVNWVDFFRLYPTHPHEQAAIDAHVAGGGQFVDEAGPVDPISDSEVDSDGDTMQGLFGD
jgi:hypothetical protein